MLGVVGRGRVWCVAGVTGLDARAVTSPHSLHAKESTNRQRRQAGATWLSPILLALTWLQRRSPLRSRPVIPGAPRPSATGVAFERAFPRLSPTRVVGEPSPRGAAWASCRDSAARCLAGYGVMSHPASQAPAQTSFKWVVRRKLAPVTRPSGFWCLTAKSANPYSQ